MNRFFLLEQACPFNSYWNRCVPSILIGTHVSLQETVIPLTVRPLTTKLAYIEYFPLS